MNFTQEIELVAALRLQPTLIIQANSRCNLDLPLKIVRPSFYRDPASREGMFSR